MNDVVLTADRTLMTEYNGLTPLGNVACLPDRLVPNFILKLLLPKLQKERATYALRRMEGKLLDEGFNVTILRPQEIKKIKKIKPKIVGVSTVDPLTKKPHPWTLTNIFGGGESVIQREFFDLLTLLNKLRRRQKFTILIGGPGASEFERSEKYFDLFDTAVIGPGEGSIELFQMALNEEPLPKRFYAKSTGLEDLSIIKAPSRNGHVQITQGCPRGCQFCGPALLKWRSFPINRILKEIEINLRNGIKQISLVTEDLFLYGSKDVEVNQKAILNLMASISELKEKYDVSNINISNVSFASVVKGKKVCEKMTDIMGFSDECLVDTIVGLETGSERLIKKYMEGKAKPFSPDSWSELVKEGINIMNDNYWYPICSLITGLPGENEDDIIKTLDLVDDLMQNNLFYYIFYFAPVEGSELEKCDFFFIDDLSERRWELFYRCWMKSIRSIKDNLRMFIHKSILEYMISKILNEIEKDLKNYRQDPFGMSNAYSQVNLKGLNLITFLGKRYLN